MADEDIKIGGYTVAADLATIEGEIKRVGRDKIGFGESGFYTDVSPSHPLPVTDDEVAEAITTLAAALSAGGGATSAKQDVIKGALDLLHADFGTKLKTLSSGVAPPLGYAQVAALTTSAGLPQISGAIPSGAVTAVVVPRAPIRWRDDATAPTGSVGMYLAADQPLSYVGSLANFRMVAVTGSVEVNVSYYGAEA